MKEKLKQYFQSGALSLKTLLLWLVLASVVGAICGFVGGAFHLAVEGVTHLRQGQPWLLLLMPAAGLLIVWLYQKAGMKNDRGTNQIIASVRGLAQPPFRLAPLIFVASVLTHLTGGSAGREGAALQIGGSIAATIGNRCRLSQRGMTIIVMCGMSGLFSALFGTPLTATIFSMEVVSIGIFHYSALFPCLLSSLVATGITRLLGIPPESYPFMGTLEGQDWKSLLLTGVLGILCAVLSILFCILMRKVSQCYQKLLPNQYLRIVVGAVLVILLTVIEGSGDYNGAGSHIIHNALMGSVSVPWAFLLKMVFTALTLGAGFRGGEIIPTLFIGATFGCAIGPLLGMNPAFAAAICMIALFCGVVNCPIASILLSVELFGSSHILFFALACALSYMLSGKFSLYTSQKIVYSKLEPQFIDADTH